MTVTDVYTKYKTPVNLQEHMLRVAAVGQKLLAGWTGKEINKTACLYTMLFHDIAKPVNFDINKQSQFTKNEAEQAKMRECVEFLVSNYGTDEHLAAAKIFAEIGLGKTAIRMINNLEWDSTDELLRKDDAETLICIYADMRVTPTGVVPAETRIKELYKRRPEFRLQDRLAYARRLEGYLTENLAAGFDLNRMEDIEQAKNMLVALEIV